MRIRIVVTGRSYHTADGLPDQIDLPDGSTVDDALRVLAGRLRAEESFPASCLIAVAGEHVGTIASHHNKLLQSGDELLLIAPVAGG